MRLDLGLQRLHARFEHRALELLGIGALGGLVGGQLRLALAAATTLMMNDAMISISDRRSDA